MSEHLLGAYTIQIWKDKGQFVYDIFRHRALIACGHDYSVTEAAAIAGIAARFGIADASKQFFVSE